jgi:hypothetical protein
MKEDFKDRIQVNNISDVEKDVIKKIKEINPTMPDEELGEEYFIKCLKQTFNSGKNESVQDGNEQVEEEKEER